jgi:UDP-MurNAc hydroxylase
MEITSTGHAGLWIKTPDVKILCDPWLHKNPKFFKTWSVYPNNNHLDWDKIIKETDILFISHIHRDHFDEEFLIELRKKNKDIKILLPDFRFCTLRDDFEKIGFNNFTLKELKIGNTTIVTYPSETIDREKEDCCLCINDGNITFFNWNDSTITPEAKKDVIKRFKKIDWASGQFSGANWYPTCYNYDEEKKLDLIDGFKKRKIVHFERMIEYLGVNKIIPIAGPACFLQKEMFHLNYFENNKTIFYDQWDIPEFDKIDKIYRVLPGDTFTYNNIQDIKTRPFDKKKFILDNQYTVDYTIDKKELELLDNKIINFFSNLLNNNSWLSKYIPYKIYISIKNYKCFCLNFLKQSIEIVDSPNKKRTYYIIQFEQNVIYELIEKNITDWEQAFLSCTCKFERNPDIFNPWVLSFFRNLDNNRLQRIFKLTQSSEVLEGKMIVGDYEVNRYCPHQQYDLMYHSKIDLENKTIQCLGHGWKWDLETCKGINCSAKIICNKIIRK